jgi:hypothetical protein
MCGWKKSILCLVALNLFWAACAPVISADDKVFVGEIADTPCAMQVHSLDRTHTEMLKVKGVGTTATDCVMYCVKNRGGRYALLTKRNVYRLDNQKLAEGFAGRKVKLTGTIVPQTDLIKVTNIDLIPDSSN